MSKFIIQGGSKLSGTIEVKGAKNLALKIIPASILSSSPITITNLPNIEDVNKSLELIESLGGKVERSSNSCTIDTSNIKNAKLDNHLAGQFRASIMFTAPLLARFGKVEFPHPGGCVLGAGGRPIDLFLDGFAAFGAKISLNERSYIIEAPILVGCEFFFNIVSVTATESMLMCACLAKGTTTLKNCAMEPEIIALANYLTEMGVKISGIGSPTMIIEGITNINAGVFDVIPDRIEAGTFAIMAALTKSNIKITNCNPKHLEILLNIFKKQEIVFETADTSIEIFPTETIKPYGIKTHEYPGFPTDLQPPFTLLATQANGTTLVHETIYDQRLLFTDMLNHMGADIITFDPHRVRVTGPTKLYGHKLISPDLRAGITLILAGLIATGTTQIDNIYQVDRGYENIDQRLKALGANITRVE
ncbi:UDP-N-acetylglucosamine 1-carboxyvinyltransferase [Patescibacteria group bacterium]|nr:UDP-N-acetylglucosamine 1-carboxyvinyltransferase [Patescibacteria group bacterium]